MKISLQKIFTDIITGEWGDEDLEGKGVNIIRTTNFQNDGRIDYTDVSKRLIQKNVIDSEGNDVYITDVDKINQKALIDGDIIIEKSGGGVGTPVGRVVYFENPDKAIYLCNNFTQTLRVDRTIALPKYAYYYLNYLYKRGNVLRYQNQTTGIFNLKLERYLKEQIFLPDFDRQHLVITQLDTIQKTIDKRATSLKLTNNLIKSLYYKFFGNPTINTSGWQTRKLSSLGKWSTGGTPKTDVLSFYEGEIPWYTSGELGELYLKDSNKKITDLAIQKSNAKIIPPNSLMIGLYDTAAFKMSINQFECSCNQAIIYGELDEGTYTLFLYYTLLFSKEYYLAKRKGARQKNLSSTFIRNIEVIYPTSQEEIEKVKRFYSFQSKIVNLYEKLSLSLDILIRFNHLVLQNAFNPKTEIEEGPIFKRLLKSFALKDLKGNKKRLEHLIRLFEKKEFDDLKDFSQAKEMLFELIAENEILQVFKNDKLILEIK